SSRRASAVRNVMESHPDLAIRAGSFDADPWALNTPGGIVDLRRGTLRPPDQQALCSRATSVPVEFDGAHPVWTRFLHDATGGDPAFIDYLQRFAGYALTGRTDEQCLLYLWGRGGNGKSVFLNVLTGILGDYAVIAPSETFINGKGFDRHSTEIAMLAGARLVTASEVEYGKAWHTTRIKSLTGGEPVTARFMRQDNFTFTPAFKLLIAGNARPQVANLDHAMRRRLHLVPFVRTPAVVDRLLPEKLRHEYPAILAWMIAGCLRWQRDGLTAPPVIANATNDYFTEEDAIGRWLSECCVEGGPTAITLVRDLFGSWALWCRQTGETVGTEREFVQRIIAAGCEPTRATTGAKGRAIAGLVLRSEPSLADLL
ncbi:MAG: phage/plasmid primase, P4 family, partial [Gemmatimonadaceae bacterium]|nr:phage/plasmid primase, P4 family [Gemmatimonadaceae bacterium]